MKRSKYTLGISGAFLILLVIILRFTTGLDIISSDLIFIGLGLLGAILLAMALSVDLDRYKSEEQLIEENDERNNLISMKAKSKVLNLVLTLFPLSLLILATMGFMNKISFFSMVIVIFFTVGYYLFQVSQEGKKI
ncbi:hypothetical protein F7984_17835 [Pradoshia sp. D12]|uniref:hypothetical protein n=1 Tax=Bacillaceae TaxID=186817 RepID=UPI00112EFADA|nr:MULTISPECIES: hypothetical protein [Bacillaceae]QFK72952.1 hypothetical protein F7984_17835 [Pradoshia sp. D12]TPF71944.1 hypothetical protein FHY44_10530 [Bacillus sp. D12]